MSAVAIGTLGGGRRRRASPLPPARMAWAITAGLALAYVILAPASSDLAAAAYRSDLFARVGFTLWDNSWYGGHHLPAYSLIAPALGALLTPQLVAALSMTAAAALFPLLVGDSFGPRAARLAAAWFALGAGIQLLSNRVPFDLGLAVGLAALVATRWGRPGLAGVLAVLTAVASPVAGAFLALAYLAWALAGGGRVRALALALTLAALTPIAALAILFPEGGTQPFVASAFYPALAGVLLIAVVAPADARTLRVGALLYAAAMTLAYVLPTAVGANADRLGAIFGAPALALVLGGGSLRGARARLLLVLAPALLYWQANAPVSDYASAAGDPAVHASYYRPLLRELRALGVGYAATPARIEAVPSPDHWEARWLAPAVPLARGWERQLDRLRNPLFYSSAPLTPAAYGAWLHAQAVSFVALPDAPLDYAAVAEGRLLRSGAAAAYLRPVWRSRHWQLFAVRTPAPLAQAPATLTRASTDSFRLSAPRPGEYTVRIHFTPYWALTSGRGCVREAAGEWTRLSLPAAGGYSVNIAFSPARVFDHGPRCR
jgi:hypothetical protein